MPPSSKKIRAAARSTTPRLHTGNSGNLSFDLVVELLQRFVGVGYFEPSGSTSIDSTLLGAIAAVESFDSEQRAQQQPGTKQQQDRRRDLAR